MVYNANALEIWLELFKQAICCAFCLALARAGNNIAAKMAMMAITTSSSIKVKPLACGFWGLGEGRFQGSLPVIFMCARLLICGSRRDATENLASSYNGFQRR